MAYSAYTYSIVYLVLTAVTVIPLAVIWVLSLLRVHRSNDHARRGIFWLKTVFPFEIIALILTPVSSGLTIAMYKVSSDVAERKFIEATYELAVIYTFFDQVASVLAIVAFVEFAIGFHCVLSASSSQQKAARFFYGVKRLVTYGAAFVLLVLTFALFGLSLNAYVAYFNALHDDSGSRIAYGRRVDVAYGSMLGKLRSASKLSSGLEIIFFVVSISLLSVGASIMVRTRRHLVLRNTGLLYFVATWVWFVRYVWHLIYVSMYALRQVSYVSVASIILDPILSSWSFLVVLVLLFVIGLRKENGIWTTGQPWMSPSGSDYNELQASSQANSAPRSRDNSFNVEQEGAIATSNSYKEGVVRK